MTAGKLATVVFVAAFYTLTGAAGVAVCWLITGASFDWFGRLSAAVLLLASLGWGVRAGLREHHRTAGRYPR